jgi:hypothetical protein
MRKAWWVALTGFALAIGVRTVGAQEPVNRPAPPPTAAVPFAPLPPGVPTVTLAPYGALLPAPYSTCCNLVPPCPTKQCSRYSTGVCPPSGCPTGSCPTAAAAPCNTCQDCGKRQRKIARFLDWLIFIPEDSKTKCCSCASPPPPAWTFFPCQGDRRCPTCATGTPTVYYTKAAGATTTSPAPPNNPVMQTAYAPPKPVAPPQPASSSDPRTPASLMPVLDPSQFRKGVANWN